MAGWRSRSSADVLTEPTADGADATPAPHLPAHAGARWGPTDQALVAGLVVLLVVTSRVGIPVGTSTVAVALPLTYVVAGVLLVRRTVTVDRLRGELFLLATTAVVGATALVSLKNQEFSVPSLVLLLTIYLPWVLRVADGSGVTVVRRAGRTFVHTMLVVAGIGIAQFGAQFAGMWRYEDYLGDVLLPDFSFPDYNTSVPLVFGSSIYKANGLVLLEPSFLSQYCALAVLIGLIIGARTWQIVVLLAGLASAVSGTGLIVLVIGVGLVLLRAPRLIRPGYVVAGVLCAVLMLLSPTASLLLDRTDEVTQPGTSGYARFVQPYAETVNGLESEPERYVTGAGPGSTERLLPSNRDGRGNDVLYSTIPKLGFEYGVIAGGLFVLFLVVAMLDRGPWRVVPGTLVVMTFVLSGGLLQPQTAYLAWVFTGLGARAAPDPV
jgi:hypothetical protein